MPKKWYRKKKKKKQGYERKETYPVKHILPLIYKPELSDERSIKRPNSSLKKAFEPVY